MHSGQTVIDAKIPDDEAIEKMLAPYSGKVRALNAVIGRLASPLKKETVGGGSLGASSPTASGGTRNKTRQTYRAHDHERRRFAQERHRRGRAARRDIFELLPFENVLVAVDLTGADLLKLLPALVRDAQSGARIQYKWNDQNRPEFISGKLVDENGHEQEIDPQQDLHDRHDRLPDESRRRRVRSSQ